MMFGLGKKSAKKQATTPVAAPASAGAAIPEERIITMPPEYRSVAPSSGKSSKRALIIAGGSALFLVVVSAGLYAFFFLGGEEPAAPEAKELPVATPREIETPPAVEEPQDTIIRSQAYTPAGELLGELAMTVPSEVAERYGASIGITVLGEEDVALPADIEHYGGMYSLYPNGLSFSQAVSLEAIVTDLTATSSREGLYPATLRGTTWEAIAGYQETLAGWSFAFEKFPVGPIAIVRSAPATESEEAPGAVRSSPDTDADGLTDREELLLGTNVSSADTDEDTYDDRTELMNDYSPLGAGQKIAEANLVASYTNPTYGYSVAYPRAWLANSLDTTNKQVLFISDTEEFFEILVEENPLNTPIAEWYRAQSPSLANAALSATIIDGVPAVWSADGLTLYAGRDGLVYILTYNKGTLDAVNWPAMFEYFHKHFRFGNTAAAAPGESASE